MNIDLSKLSTPQLLAIKNVLLFGTEAFATKIESAEVRRLKKINERLRTRNARYQDVVEAGLEWDESYFMALDDKTFNFILGKLKQQKAESANAGLTILKVPALVGQIMLNPVEVVREGFATLKAERKGI